MNKKHNTGPLHDIRVMTSIQLEEQYGIEINNVDGSVRDPVEDRVFKSIQEWANFLEEQDSEDNYGAQSKIPHKHMYEEY